MRQLPDGRLRFTVTGPAGTLLAIDYSIDMADWSQLGRITILSEGMPFTLTPPTTTSPTFYRGRVP